MQIKFIAFFVLVISSKVWAADTTKPPMVPYEIITAEYEVPSVVDASKKVKMRSVSGISFRDAKGHDAKHVTFNIKNRMEKGKYKYRKVSVLENKDKNHVVVFEQVSVKGEQNPYKLRTSSNTHIMWYTATGMLKCDLQARYFPKVLSSDGRSMVVTDIGFDPVEFEKFQDVPGIDSTESLKNDASLTTAYLRVLDDNCQTVYSTSSSKGGWTIVMISPSGKWLLLEENESGVVAPGKGWINFLKVVNLTDGQIIIVKSDRRLHPWEIDDEGTMVTWKAVGYSNRKHRIKIYGGGEVDAPYEMYRKYVWRLGDAGYRETQEERESADGRIE